MLIAEMLVSKFYCNVVPFNVNVGTKVIEHETGDLDTA